MTWQWTTFEPPSNHHRTTNEPPSNHHRTTYEPPWRGKIKNWGWNLIENSWKVQKSPNGVIENEFSLEKGSEVEFS